ncbi:MAG: hypothetical protein GY754_31520 [bacterium]|nr:hypothetical protein [bacterium]
MKKYFIIVLFILVCLLITVPGARSAASYSLAVDSVSVSNHITQENQKEDGFQMLDHNLNTAWQYTYNPENKEEAVFHFKKPCSITRVKLFNGYGKRYWLYKKNGRALNITFSSGAEKKDFILKRKIYNYEELPLHFKNVTKLSMTIESVQKGSKYNDIAISEIEFFGSGIARKEFDPVGMMPVVIADTVDYHHKISDSSGKYRVVVFDGCEMRSKIIWGGFYDLKLDRVIKRYKNVNKIIPVIHMNSFLLFSGSYGTSPGAIQPFLQNAHILKIPGSSSMKRISVKAQMWSLKLYTNAFGGDRIFMLPNGNADYKFKHYYNYNGKFIKKTKKAPGNFKLASSGWALTYNQKNGYVKGVDEKWLYKSNVKRGEFLHIGRGLYALRREFNTIDCCGVGNFDSEILIFDKKGFVRSIKFSKKKKVYPFGIRLYAEPCSA